MADERPQRLVLDTNVVLSALVFQSGQMARFRQLWSQRVLVPLVSSATAKELIRVLSYPKFKLTEAQREELLADYLPYTEVVKLDPNANALLRLPSCRDPHDQPFLELAQAGNADWLVTGDRALLELHDPSFRRLGFGICSPAEFLARWPS